MSDRRARKPLSKILEEFEQEQWGTNDLGEILEAVRQENYQERQAALTGMDGEQADWEEGSDE